MFKQDRNCFGGRLIEHIVIHIVFHIDKEPEVICLEINPKLRKWPIVGLYKRLSQIKINIRLRNWPIVGLYKRLSQIKINIRLRNWPIVGLYKPSSQNNFCF